MRRLYLACTFLALSGVASLAEDATPDTSKIQEIIQSQIEAFRADDFSRAFEFASPAIRHLFGSSQNFGAMVRSGYPMVWRPGEVRFLELRDEKGVLKQKVIIRDMAGAVHVLDYQMIEFGDGWRINGVDLLRAPEVGA